MPGNLSLSVVVPTRDRPASLARCLAALARQDVAQPLEIVVVDDGSRRARDVAAVVAAHPAARLVRTAPAGSVGARNRGAVEAKGNVLLYIDDDCEARPEWARLLLEGLDEATAVTAGPVVNATPPDVLGEATQVVLDHLTHRSLRPDGTAGFVPTYNLACRRDLVLELPFEDLYGNSGADRDWCARLGARGLSIRLVPSALVVHRQCLDVRRFLRKHYRYGRGSALFRHRHGLGLERPGFYADLLRAGFRRGVLVGVALCAAQGATALGFVVERLGGRR